MSGVKKHVLKIGKHSYNGKEVEMVPIMTTHYGLCYKIQLYFPFENHAKRKNYIQFEIGITVPVKIENEDQIEKIKLLIAAENTWQGKKMR